MVWHGHYVKYLEVARCALLERRPRLPRHGIGLPWPVIDLQLRYARRHLRPALNVRASLVEWENRLKINYLISDAETGERMTRASTVQVAAYRQPRNATGLAASDATRCEGRRCWHESPACRARGCCSAAPDLAFTPSTCNSSSASPP
jgi:acyl-CoA thioesterase FadM